MACEWASQRNIFEFCCVWTVVSKKGSKFAEMSCKKTKERKNGNVLCSQRCQTHNP